MPPIASLTDADANADTADANTADADTDATASHTTPWRRAASRRNMTLDTPPRPRRRRSWLYRVRPSVIHSPFVPCSPGKVVSDWNDPSAAVVDPNQMRWNPMPIPDAAAGESVDFLDGLVTMCGHGDPMGKEGCAIHMYTCNASMGDKCFTNSDGDLLIVPQVSADKYGTLMHVSRKPNEIDMPDNLPPPHQVGTLDITTEFGKIMLAPHEICVIQRGIRFNVAITDATAPATRGYVFELYQGHLQLPDLGPIGANGLANARDFLYPCAAFEDRDCEYTVINKFGGKVSLRVSSRAVHPVKRPTPTRTF